MNNKKIVDDVYRIMFKHKGIKKRIYKNDVLLLNKTFLAPCVPLFTDVEGGWYIRTTYPEVVCFLKKYWN